MTYKHLLWSIVYLVLFQVCESKLCGVYIDCDVNCIKRFGTDTVNIINLFQKSISPYNSQNYIEFKLEGIRYHPELDLKNRDAVEILEYYKNLQQYKYSLNNCANVLLTKITSGNVLGIAYVAGKCSIQNVAVVNNDIDLISMALVMGHEMGHILGLEHTCELNSKNIYNSCTVLDGNECNPSMHPYLMYPVMNLCSQNINKLSKCSIQQLSQIESNLICESPDTFRTEPISISITCNKNSYSELSIVTIVFILMSCLLIGFIIIYYYITFPE
jgi:hypothetical protein